MERLKQYAIEIVISVIGGLILFVIQQQISLTWVKSILIIAGILIIVLIVYLVQMMIKIRSLGIVNILNSQIKGPGSTKAFMKKANQEICFVGIAASKWVNETEEFENMIRRICGHQAGKIRFLLLSPHSEAARRLNVAARAQGQKSIQEKIDYSLEKITEILNKLNKEANGINYAQNFKVKLYSQMPIYRLTLIDHSSAYFSFYRLNDDGKKLKQLQIVSEREQHNPSNNIYNSLAEYFENIWESPDSVVYELKECSNMNSAQNEKKGKIDD